MIAAHAEEEPDEGAKAKPQNRVERSRSRRKRSAAMASMSIRSLPWGVWSRVLR
jgi:hypothetical protein